VVPMLRRFASMLSVAIATSLAVLWLMAVSPVSAGDPCYHGFDVPPLSSDATVEIKVMPCAFGPTVAHVATGSTVTFFNGPTYTHLITGANQAWGSRDTELEPTQTVSYTFDKAGTYPYACALHRGMSGTIVVEDVPAASSAVPGVATSVTGGDASTTGRATGGTTSEVPSSGDGAGLELAIALLLAGGAGVLLGAVVALAVMRPRRRQAEPSTPRTA
jgi:plastocyanin